jgi:UDP:flavonoid glycosyltransferase YjiC (YdhE family)
MRRIGILSFSSPGHYYPLTALGRRLQSRGHEVVYFQVAEMRSWVSSRAPPPCGAGFAASDGSR